MTSARAPQVLVLGLNFPPESTGISPYTGAMARGLHRNGFDTQVLTTHPHYPEWRTQPGGRQWHRRDDRDGVRVDRLRHYVPSSPRGIRRLISEFSFGARATSRRWGRPDVIITVSPAMIASAMAVFRARVTHPRTPVVVWVQDLYTLGLAETGQATGIALAAMRAIERWLLRSADQVVVIHNRFADRVVRDFGVERRRVAVVRNWTHLSPTPGYDVGAVRASHNWAQDDVVVLHAGNMGLKQGLDNVIETARLASSRGERVRFVLLGAGSELERLRALGAGIPNLEFLSPVSDEEFTATLGSANILLVNERPGVAEMAVPSKLTSYFASGRPVVAATDLNGITADEVRAADAGVVVPAGDPFALLSAVLELGSDEAEAFRLGNNARLYRQTVLDEDTAIRSFSEILGTLIQEGTAPQTRPDHTKPVEDTSTEELLD
ncbi:glycosyltransferase [Microbacterium sp. C7(2022)]|nr:glycosyltransferase [Microbacterium sp. C7(2022)]